MVHNLMELLRNPLIILTIIGTAIKIAIKK